jgi:hypothetical protein
MKTITELRECYGNLFPDFTRLKRGEPQDGQAFRALISGTGTGAQDRNVEVKAEAWLKCSECPDFRGCYDLSLAKMLMNQVLMNTCVANPWVGA